MSWRCSIKEKNKQTKNIIVLCSTWTLNVSFTSGFTKKVTKKTQICHCCFCFCWIWILSCCWNPEKRRSIKEKEKKKRAIISSIRYVYFHVLYRFLRNGLCLLHFLLLYLCIMQPFVSHREIHKDLFLNLCSLSFIWQVSNFQSTEGWQWSWWDVIIYKYNYFIYTC